MDDSDLNWIRRSTLKKANEYTDKQIAELTKRMEALEKRLGKKPHTLDDKGYRFWDREPPALDKTEDK